MQPASGLECIRKAETCQIAPNRKLALTFDNAAIRDRDIAHAFRDAKDDKLSAQWFRDLPRHLRTPQAVILDETHDEGPALLLIFDAPDAAEKLVVRVNYRLKKAGEINLVQTGQIVDLQGIVSGQGKGYALLHGKL